LHHEPPRSRSPATSGGASGKLRFCRNAECGAAPDSKVLRAMRHRDQAASGAIARSE